jgi:hypothetical protein
MGIFAKKCERCGKKNRSQSEPVCETCQKEMDLLLEARQENSRACPIDGTPMSKSIAHLIVIDRCPECQGVWLDGGELEKIYARASDSALVEVTRGLWVPLG